MYKTLVEHKGVTVCDLCLRAYDAFTENGAQLNINAGTFIIGQIDLCKSCFVNKIGSFVNGASLERIKNQMISLGILP